MSIANRVRYWEEIDNLLEDYWKLPPQLRNELMTRYNSDIEKYFESGEDASDAAFNLHSHNILNEEILLRSI